MPRSGWYDTNSNINFDAKTITTNDAAAAKGISEAFNGFGKVLSDREATNKLDAELERKKLNDEQDLKLKLQNAYNIQEDRGIAKQEKADKLAQDEINNEVFKEMLKYKTKEEFSSNVNPDLVKFADGKTMVATEAFYNKSEQEKENLKRAAEDAENKIKLAEMGLKLQEQKVKTESAKGKAESSDNRSVKAADDSLIGKNIATLFGGVYDPSSGEISGLDKDNAKKVAEIQSNASRIYKENKDITHNEASYMAFKNYEKSLATPIIQENTRKPENKESVIINKPTEEDNSTSISKSILGDREERFNKTKEKIGERLSRLVPTVDPDFKDPYYQIRANIVPENNVTPVMDDTKKVQNPEQAARLKKLEEIKNMSLK